MIDPLLSLLRELNMTENLNLKLHLNFSVLPSCHVRPYFFLGAYSVATSVVLGKLAGADLQELTR